MRKTENDIRLIECRLREEALVEAGYAKVVEGRSVGWSKDGWTLWDFFWMGK